jgi:hypothetical protein
MYGTAKGGTCNRGFGKMTAVKVDTGLSVMPYFHASQVLWLPCFTSVVAGDDRDTGLFAGQSRKPRAARSW